LPTISLNGIRVEVPHSKSVEDMCQELERVAHSLAEKKFRSWAVRMERLESGALQLTGGQDGTHFRAELTAIEAKVVMALTGSVQLGRLKFTIAGGETGVRRRVTEGIEKTLREHVF
jgi:hypothetical protein